MLNIKCVDGYPFVIDNKKISKNIVIYSGYNFVCIKDGKIEKDVCYVAEKDNFKAHGKTVKKAVSDLKFKMVSEKLKKEPIKPNTLITLIHYRLVTGACEFGCRDWMKRNGIKKEKIKAEDLLHLLTETNAYGLDKFKSLYTQTN
jgi:hypothetical protein